jgi:hypothetical protein
MRPNPLIPTRTLAMSSSPVVSEDAGTLDQLAAVGY